MNSFWKYNLPSLAWALLILILCLVPGKEFPSLNIVDLDKAVHFLIYLALSALMFVGWKKQDVFSSLHRNSAVKILMLTFSYGFLVEIVQELLTADRHFELYDALANAAGGVAGCAISPILKIKKNDQQKKRR